MLRRSRRLRSAEVREVLASGRALRGGGFLSAKHVGGTIPLRSAIVVSKSVAKSAVVRNRLRRVLYSALREVASGTGNIVFFMRKVPPSPLAPVLRQEIEGIISQILSTKP